MLKQQYVSPSIQAVELLPDRRILDGSPLDDYNAIPSVDQLFFGSIVVDSEFA